MATALRAAVAAGYWVLAPGQPPQHGATPDFGYVLLDPRTGATAVLLADGVHGGVQPVCQTALRPTPAPVLFPIVVTLPPPPAPPR